MLSVDKYRHIVLNSYRSLYYSLPVRKLTSVLLRKYKLNNQLSIPTVDRCMKKYQSALAINQLQFKQLKREYKAVCELIQRSQINKTHNNGFHTSSSQNGQGSSNNNNKQKNDKKNSGEDENKLKSVLAKAFLWMLTAYMVIAIISMIFPSKQQQEQMVRYVSWNEFLHHMLTKGEVEQIIVRPDMDVVTIILHEGAIIKGRKMDHRTFHMSIVDINKFEDKLRHAERMLGVKEGIPVIYERNSDVPGKLLISLIIAAIIISLLSKGKSFKPPSMDSFTQMGRAKFTLVDPVTAGGKGVLFKDVAGLQEAKIEVMEFVDYLKNPQRYRSLGAKVPKGALLLGPPGCGKTLLAKAVATEAEVPFLSMNGSEFIEMIGGLGAARVRDLFKEAGKRAPCIIYIDEIDAIGRQRGGAGGNSGSGGNSGGAPGSGESEQTLNQLLVEMDGMASREGVLMLASTNRPDVLDKALLRPGRFDRHILIDLPNLTERKEIFIRHLSPLLLKEPAETYASRLATLTPGFSGADIANVCNEAALHAAKLKSKVVSRVNFEYAIERVVGGTEKRSHSMSPGERKTIAYHEAGHALVGWLMQHTDALLKVTIVPRTTLALGFAMYTPNEQKLYSKEQLFERMCMALGGRVAESLTFNKVTTGASNDLDKVTKMAYAQIRQYGMCDAIGLVSFPDNDGSNTGSGKKPYSKRLASLIDNEARTMITEAYKKTEQVLTDNKDKLKLLADNLLERETLNYDDVEKLIGPPPYGPKKLIGLEEFVEITEVPPPNVDKAS